MRLVSVSKSPAKGKKLMAVFEQDGKTLRRHFGAAGYDDYTTHYKKRGKAYADARKALYVARHGREDWSVPTSPAALSRYILWDKPTVHASVGSFKRRFKL